MSQIPRKRQERTLSYYGPLPTSSFEPDMAAADSMEDGEYYTGPNTPLAPRSRMKEALEEISDAADTSPGTPRSTDFAAGGHTAVTAGFIYSVICATRTIFEATNVAIYLSFITACLLVVPKVWGLSSVIMGEAGATTLSVAASAVTAVAAPVVTAVTWTTILTAVSVASLAAFNKEAFAKKAKEMKGKFTRYLTWQDGGEEGIAALALNFKKVLTLVYNAIGDWLTTQATSSYENVTDAIKDKTKMDILFYMICGQSPEKGKELIKNLMTDGSGESGLDVVKLISNEATGSDKNQMALKAVYQWFSIQTGNRYAQAAAKRVNDLANMIHGYDNDEERLSKKRRTGGGGSRRTRKTRNKRKTIRRKVVKKSVRKKSLRKTKKNKRKTKRMRR